jgi:hypothetical protein
VSGAEKPSISSISSSISCLSARIPPGRRRLLSIIHLMNLSILFLPKGGSEKIISKGLKNEGPILNISFLTILP